MRVRAHGERRYGLVALGRSRAWSGARAFVEQNQSKGVPTVVAKRARKEAEEGARGDSAHLIENADWRRLSPGVSGFGGGEEKRGRRHPNGKRGGVLFLLRSRHGDVGGGASCWVSRFQDKLKWMVSRGFVVAEKPLDGRDRTGVMVVLGMWVRSRHWTLSSGPPGRRAWCETAAGDETVLSAHVGR